MRTVAEVRQLAANRYRRHFRAWLGSDGFGQDEVWRIPVHPPTEAEFTRDRDAVARWVTEWRSVVAPAQGLRLEDVVRRWPSWGRQSLPSHLVATGATAVSELAELGDDWRALVSRAESLRGRWPDAIYLADGLTAIARGLGRVADNDVDKLADVVSWLVRNPSSGLLARQLPVPGVDTKWFERHSGLVSSLAAAVSGSSELGLTHEAQRFRVRVLDPEVGGFGRVHDLTATVAELGRADVSPSRVLVVENLASLASLPPLTGTIALHGRGYAVAQLASVGWVRDAPLLDYWGDLDSHGLAILGRCREVLPQTRSLLMDRATLREFHELAVTEPRPYRAPVSGLAPEETATLALLLEHQLRLEQERLPLSHVFSML